MFKNSISKTCLCVALCFSTSAIAKSVASVPKTAGLSGVTTSIFIATNSGVVSNRFISASSANNSTTLGMKAGYGLIREQQPGFIARLAVGTKVGGVGWANYTLIRPEFDATVGFTENIYALGGLNLNKYVGGFSDLDVGLGWQLGFGAMFNRFAVELEYVSVSNSTAGTSLTLAGPEISFGYTF